MKRLIIALTLMMMMTAVSALAGDLSVTGKLGIGITAPTNPFQVYTSTMVVTSTGRLGLGVSAPAHILEFVAGTTAAGGIGFGTDTELYRSAANTLALASGDSLNIVSGALQVAGTGVVTSGRLVQTANGTVTAPAHTFSADTNSGLYSVGNDTMTFTTAGVAKMTINATNVGIGTTAPAQKLDVVGTVQMTGFKMATGAGLNKVLTSDASGVGTWATATGGSLPTGTTSQTLRHNGTTWVADSFLFNNGANLGIGTTNLTAGAGIIIDKAATNYPAIILTSSGPGWGSGMKLINTATGGREFGMYTSSENPSKFYIADNTAAAARITIDSTGNVGVGTATPANKLHVYGTVATGEVIAKVQAAGSNGTPALALVNTNNSEARLQYSYLDNIQMMSPGGIQILSGGWNERMIITSAGLIGIGGVTPTARVDVNGATGYNQFRMRTTYTPTSTSDTNGNVGDMAWDTNYVYIKTSAGWKRSALGTW